MDKEFNKEIMFANISFLLEKHGKKIGELESEAGVSTGYISRTNKDSSTKPGIDFIINVADALKISIDTLINIDLSELTPTELYLISFFEKLKKDTLDDKLEWNKESADFFNRQDANTNGYADHPMLNLETFYPEGEDGYPSREDRVIIVSETYDKDTFMYGDCFHLNMKDGAKLYITNVGGDTYDSNGINEPVIEVWMYEPNLDKQFLSSSQKESKLSILVDDLYQTIVEFSKHPKIKAEMRSVIDAYIKNDDLNHTPYDDLPF